MISLADFQLLKTNLFTYKIMSQSIASVKYAFFPCLALIEVKVTKTDFAFKTGVKNDAELQRSPNVLALCSYLLLTLLFLRSCARNSSVTIFAGKQQMC